LTNAEKTLNNYIVGLRASKHENFSFSAHFRVNSRLIQVNFSSDLELLLKVGSLRFAALPKLGYSYMFLRYVSLYPSEKFA